LHRGGADRLTCPDAALDLAWTSGAVEGATFLMRDWARKIIDPGALDAETAEAQRVLTEPLRAVAIIAAS